MNVGTLRHRVSLENPGVAVPDGDGGYTQVNVPLSPSEVWADIRPATARDLERVTSGTVMASASHIVTIRYHAGVTTQTRILFGSRVLAVTGVQNPEERNIALVLTAEEMVA